MLAFQLFLQPGSDLEGVLVSPVQKKSGAGIMKIYWTSFWMKSCVVR